MAVIQFPAPLGLLPVPSLVWQLVKEGNRDTKSLQEYHLEIVSDQHPLEDLLEDNSYSRPIILLSKALQVDPQSPHTPNSVNETQGSFDGSPLKLQKFQMSESTPTAIGTRTGKIMQGVSISETRKLISLYNLATQQIPDLHEVMPLWVLCDGQDDGQLITMGTHVSDAGSGLFSMESFSVTLRGPMHNPDKNPKIQKLLKSTCRTDNNCTIKCHAEYSVLGEISSDQTLESKDMDPSVSQCLEPMTYPSTVKIDFDWNQLSGLLHSPPLDAKGVVHATIALGDSRSPSHHLYKEFTVLQGISEGLKTGLIHWSREDSEVPLKQRVSTFIEDVSIAGSGHQTQQAEEEEEIFCHQKILQVIERKDLDFTERLWNILKDCTCMSELIDSFKVVFDSLQSGKIQPMVHKSNNSQLAQLVRDSYYGNMTAPPDDNTLLEILIEVGIEKLVRDYSKAFISQDLATVSCLEYFTSCNGSLMERMVRLEKMYCSLELVIILECFLGLPPVTQNISARHALKHYTTHDVDPTHVFTIPVTPKALAGSLEQWSVCKWKAEVISHQGQHDVHSVFQLTVRPPPFTHLHLEDTSDVKDRDDKGCDYYLTTVSQCIVTI